MKTAWPQEYRDRFIQAIEKDGMLCANALVNGVVPGCDNPGHCAFGAALFHVGFSNEQLAKLPADITQVFAVLVGDPPLWMKAGKALAKHYGLKGSLGMDIAAAIINKNDRHSGPHRNPNDSSLEAWQARAKAVVDYIKNFDEHFVPYEEDA